MFFVTQNERDHSDHWSWDKGSTRKKFWEQRILPLLPASDTKTLTIERWGVCTEEFKNPLFHETWATKQCHCQACLKSFLAVQVPNQLPDLLDRHASKVPRPMTLEAEIHEKNKFPVAHQWKAQFPCLHSHGSYSSDMLCNRGHFMMNHSHQGACTLLGSDIAKQLS